MSFAALEALETIIKTDATLDDWARAQGQQPVTVEVGADTSNPSMDMFPYVALNSGPRTYEHENPEQASGLPTLRFYEDISIIFRVSELDPRERERAMDAFIQHLTRIINNNHTLSGTVINCFVASMEQEEDHRRTPTPEHELIVTIYERE